MIKENTLRTQLYIREGGKCVKWHPLCIQCAVRVAYDLAVESTDDEELHRRAVVDTVNLLSNILNQEEDVTPAKLLTHVFRLVQKITGNSDPFRELRKEFNKTALSLIPFLEEEFKKREKEKSFEDAFRFAVLGAVYGNYLNYKASPKDIEKFLMDYLKEDLAIDDVPKLMNALSKAKNVLYLTDNAGEIVFDKFLINVITKHYPVNVVVAVKSTPILNDAILDDALQIGLMDVAKVITGCSSVGLHLEDCSEEFLEHLEKADIIIAKGQGHYESLSQEHAHIVRKPIVYLLKVKCRVIAGSLGVSKGANIVKIIS